MHQSLVTPAYPILTMESQIRSKSGSLFSAILARFHAGYFRISLSLGCQALLWKILLQSHHDARFALQVPKLFYSAGLVVLWSFAIVVLLLLSLLYSLKCFLCFDSIRAEFVHHVGVNYLFAPWISWLLVLEAAPAPGGGHAAAFVVSWWAFAIPVVILDVKIYGQWFTKGRRFLTAVANPTSQLSVVGNLVGARAAARTGWPEAAVFLFSLGMAHYLVLFVTLYQRLAGGDLLPAMLRPVFFLFFAAPSLASLAWYSIAGSFDTASKMLFFLSLFLFVSLICRPFLFKKSMERYNIAWWAFSYPITILALASARYEEEVRGGIPCLLRLLLSILSILILLVLLLFSAFNPKLLLPDDDAILVLTSAHHLPTQSPKTIASPALDGKDKKLIGQGTTKN